GPTRPRNPSRSRDRSVSPRPRRIGAGLGPSDVPTANLRSRPPAPRLRDETSHRRHPAIPTELVEVPTRDSTELAEVRRAAVLIRLSGGAAAAFLRRQAAAPSRRD